MSGENDLDPRRLTFSQAQGYEKLPQQLKLEELSDEARTRLWNILYLHVHGESGSRFGSNTQLGARWKGILLTLHLQFHVRPINGFNPTLGSFVKEYQPFLMKAVFNKVFDLLLAIMRHSKCPQQFTESVGLAFKACRLAYVVDFKNPVTIFPAATEEEGEAVLRATTELSNAGLAGAASHLRQASDCIGQGDFPGAVRESIHAVESTARQIDPNAKSLELALKSLERANALHSALKQAFVKLYGYTCDEQGIRHALIDNPQANVGQDEAVFMLGACASFSSYLVRKHQRQALRSRSG